MRILSIHTDAYGGKGGIAAYNRDYLRAFCAHPAVSEVVALVLNGAGHHEALPPKLRLWRQERRDTPRFLRALGRRLLTTAPFDLVVCGHVNLLPAAALASALHRAPLLLYVYGIDVWKPPPSRLSRQLLGRVDAFCSISQLTFDKMDGWRNRCGAARFVSPNAVHHQQFGPGPRPQALLERYGLAGRKVLLTVARLNSLERYKGIDEVMELMPALCQTHERLSYLIVGDGDDQARLERKATSLGIFDRVVFAGYVPDQELADHYRLADAYVMPGSGEGFGFVYLEALACGIPVVASKVDGSREAVRDGLLGAVVDPADPEDILRGIRTALDTPRGEVDPNLAYFYFDQFVARSHAMLNQLDEAKS